MGQKAKPAAIKRWINTAALCEIIITRAFELGEVARIEIEIQNSFPHGSPQPRCPCWHKQPAADKSPLPPLH
jgi:hypothetical protein